MPEFTMTIGGAAVQDHDRVRRHQPGPFGGFKWSGIGVENGTWGLTGFTEIRVVHRAKR
ncbi:MAG: aldehyde dehydrogenase family protein [Actinoallomurus sp.]